MSGFVSWGEAPSQRSSHRTTQCQMGREDKTKIHRASVLPTLCITSGMSSYRSSFLHTS